MNMLTRKELAALMTEMRGDKVTATQVRDNERRWGLDKFRSDLNRRVVRYRRVQVLAHLKSIL
jgi:hypothetical protein